MENEKHLWDKLDDETFQAYEAFGVYRDLGSKRTCSAVAEKLQKSSSLIYKWKNKFDWETRAAAYDSSILEESRQLLIARRKEYLIRRLNFGEKFFDKLEKAVDNLNPKRASMLTAAQSSDLVFKNYDAAYTELEEMEGGTKVTNIVIQRRGHSD